MVWMMRGLVALGVLVALGIAVYVVGALLPEDHVATRSAAYEQPPERVWEAITGVDEFPEWRGGIDGVERLPNREGRPVWREFSGTGPLTLEVVEAEPPRRLRLRIADADLPFGGTWTYRIEPTASGCRLTITEDGEIHNPFFRFMARFVFGYEATMDGYLVDLGSKFSEEVRPFTPEDGPEEG